MSMLLFFECTYPFHLPIADAVEANGGSSELLTILNRLGVSVSQDTLKRHMHTISRARKINGIKDLLVEGAFAVASTDNIDFLQSHAAVYCGSQHRSWHATSIQLVQPKPRSKTRLKRRKRMERMMKQKMKKELMMMNNFHFNVPIIFYCL